MYYLMNKDVVTASFVKDNHGWKLLRQNAELPLGKFEINSWLEDRKAYKHNRHLRRLMIDCGCEATEGFIQITHAASINDSFWVKEEGEGVAWDDISFYRNDFNDTISRLAFEGLGLYGMQMSSTSPELTTDGSFRKCWKKENGEIYLYKRGISGTSNGGLEPYCEALASEIIQKVDPTSVRYSVLRLHGEIATKCKAFTDEEVGFVPLRKLVGRNVPLAGLLDFFENLGCREQFQRMLVLDAVTFNVDRHLGNIGILVENSSQKPLGIAPNFDFNLSMLPYVTKEEFAHIGTKLLDYSPAVGTDFTRVGQEMLTSGIRKELVNLQGFQFSFRGNRDFEPSRVRILESMVNRQIQAILKGEALYTRDVFVPEQSIDNGYQKVGFDHSEELRLADELAARLREAGVFLSVIENIMEDGHVSVAATISEGEDYYDFVVSMEDLGISCEKNGIGTTAEEALTSGKLSDAYHCVCKIADIFYTEQMAVLHKSPAKEREIVSEGSPCKGLSVEA